MKQLVAYITASLPEKNFTIDLISALKEAGVDMIELGIPFSDPVADGLIIQKANLESLYRGFKMEQIFEISSQVTSFMDVLWMGYFNSFYKRGLSNITEKASECGVSGFVIPDLPFEESLCYQELFHTHKKTLISFIAPTDTMQRIQKITAYAKKFIYLVAYAGITGASKQEDLSETIEIIRTQTQTPIYLGFGVDEKTAKEKSRNVDGVIVGSVFVEQLNDTSTSHSQKIQKITAIASNIKNLINT